MKLLFPLFFALLICTTNQAFSQQKIALRKEISERSVPSVILNNFKKQHPVVLVTGWYVTHITYWQNDYSSDWYYGWYGHRTVVIHTYAKPNYYEVEFLDGPGEISRSIYNVHGYWYETRTRIKGLTMEIYEALKASEYNGWKISPVMEKLRSPMWPDEIYRFQVSKGLKSRILRMDAEGNLIQVKEELINKKELLEDKN
ncbi:MAG: hypothetical protein HKO54_01840 [Flavobacteriaceae bacterium]|nr:hypothetical protein [Flavobacteriaceae bacterium]